MASWSYGDFRLTHSIAIKTIRLPWPRCITGISNFRTNTVSTTSRKPAWSCTVSRSAMIHAVLWSFNCMILYWYLRREKESSNHYLIMSRKQGWPPCTLCPGMIDATWLDALIETVMSWSASNLMKLHSRLWQPSSISRKRSSCSCSSTKMISKTKTEWIQPLCWKCWCWTPHTCWKY